MALFKCKMCGGSLEVMAGTTVIECEYCGTQQTLPRLDDDKRANMYDRANHFRRNNEFDKAMSMYEKILNEDNTDAEAYWSLVLCRYGIEYVEDPVSHKRIPTVNRAQFTSIFDDGNYKSALEYADNFQRAVYEEEAKTINEIQKGILDISQKEEPFDVFICYKESDNNGRRTPDSVLAQDLYYQLKQEGFKVFFARITLEDKLGSAYEPYIFAALNSAKVMVVFGTRPEYFGAVWVKNEWSRYLALIRQGQKKMLIPAYKDMDPYDLPEEFSHLQAQDMSKLGFMQDLIRGIKKIARDNEPKTNVVKETVVTGASANIAPLVKRIFMFLEDENWDQADEYCEKVLDMDPECGDAYLGKLLAELEVKNQEDLKNQEEPFDGSNNYQKVIRFADEKLRTTLAGYIVQINTRNENARLDKIYIRAKKAMSELDYREAERLFKSISEYQDSAALAKVAKEGKKRIEEEIITCVALCKEYKAAVQNEKNGVEKKAEADKKLTRLRIAYDNLTELKDSWQGIEDEELSLNERLELLKSERDYLNNERHKLGVFSGKRKKEISERIATLDGDQQILIGKITALQKRKQGYLTLSGVESELCSKFQVMEEQKKIIEELSSIRPSQLIRDELRAFELGERLWQRFLNWQNIKKGDYITFGTYTQSDTNLNSKEDIEWLVLEVKDGKALIISKYALECLRYNEKDTGVAWETCTLRKWLNNDFINAAFLADEKAMIPMVTVSADKNPKYATVPSNATQDQVFLLSVTEAYKYFRHDRSRKCKATDFAKANGANEDSIIGNCFWWLRSPGDTQSRAAYVFPDGGIYESGSSVNVSSCAVRPALWINLNP